MSDGAGGTEVQAPKDWMHRVGLFFAFVLVCMGMLNNLPTIPGLLPSIQAIPGLGGLPRISKFNSEFFFPIIFTVMMIVALMNTSFARDWRRGWIRGRISGDHAAHWPSLPPRLW